MIYRFSPDTRITFASLEVEVQEAVLDELEDLADNTWKLRADAAGVADHENDAFVRGERHTLFLSVIMNDPSGELIVICLAAVKARP